MLVHSAAGERPALRIAAALGARRIVAVGSSPEKAESALHAGATDVVRLDDWLNNVRELTDARGIDLVIDPVGGDRFTDSLRSLAEGGQLLAIAFAQRDIPTAKVNRLLDKNIPGWS